MPEPSIPLVALRPLRDAGRAYVPGEVFHTVPIRAAVLTAAQVARFADPPDAPIPVFDPEPVPRRRRRRARA